MLFCGAPGLVLNIVVLNNLLCWFPEVLTPKTPSNYSFNDYRLLKNDCYVPEFSMSLMIRLSGNLKVFANWTLIFFSMVVSFRQIFLASPAALIELLLDSGNLLCSSKSVVIGCNFKFTDSRHP